MSAEYSVESVLFNSTNFGFNRLHFVFINNILRSYGADVQLYTTCSVSANSASSQPLIYLACQGLLFLMHRDVPRHF